MKVKTSYSIRNKTTGLYSTGGVSPKFSHNGKVWSQIGHVKAHLLKITDLEFYKDSEIVEMVEKVNEPNDCTLQKYQEHARLVRNDDGAIGSLLRNFVKTGACYTDELRDLITNENHPKRELAERFVPHQMIDKFEVYHNKGIRDCTPEELGAIILTATERQIKIYKL
ncbi:hypothetical protein XaC1_254 [Xanthomonas phage XaC1]|nr:hypothetical protein XaC1_254 [Xanthomonas phage XaC1]